MLGLPRGTEWIVILLIVIILFGPGRIGKIAGELGKGIRSFKDGLSEGKQDDEPAESNNTSDKK